MHSDDYEAEAVTESQIAGLTPFWVSGYENDWRLVSERRKREDTAFARRLGAQISYLDFPEVALRLMYLLMLRRRVSPFRVN